MWFEENMEVVQQLFSRVKEISSFNKRSKKPSFHGSKGRLGSGS